LAKKSRAVAAKGVEEYKPYVTRALPMRAMLVCADNSGAKLLQLIQVAGYKGRHRRIPSASVGDKVIVVVKKGSPELRKQIFPAVVIRQKYPIRRRNGIRVSFEDNAAVLLTPEGELKGTEIKGPVAAEAAQRFPRLATLASIII
jgi:large subunit ribosomal protein L14